MKLIKNLNFYLNICAIADITNKIMSTTSTQQNQEEMVKTMKLMMDALATHTGYLHMISEQLKTLQTIFAPLQETLESISHNTASLKPPSSPIVMEKIGNDKSFLPDPPEDDSEYEVEEDYEHYEQESSKKSSSIQPTSSNIIYVQSSSKGGKTYTVNTAYGTCTCPDYQYRHAESHTFCKHLMKVINDPFFYGLNVVQFTHLKNMCKCN